MFWSAVLDLFHLILLGNQRTSISNCRSLILYIILLLLLRFRNFRRRVISPSHQVLNNYPLISTEMAITEHLPCAYVLFRVTLVNERPHDRFYFFQSGFVLKLNVFVHSIQSTIFEDKLSSSFYDTFFIEHKDFIFPSFILNRLRQLNAVRIFVHHL